MSIKRPVYSPVETLVLTISVVKWVLIAVLIGLLVGMVSALFLVLLKGGIDGVRSFPHFYYGLPIALFMSALICRITPEAVGHGTERVLRALHRDGARLSPKVIPVKILSTVITIAFGGSVGKEGPAVQIGASTASLVASALRLTGEDRKKVVICGISAGFAAVLGTPVGGAIFGVELLFVGSIMYNVLLPSLIAGLVSFKVTNALGIEHITHFHVVERTPFLDAPPDVMMFVWMVVAGIFFGLCAILFIEMLMSTESLAKRIRWWPPLKGLLGGAILVVLVWFFSPAYLGLGLEGIDASLCGEGVPSHAFLLKMLFTVITLSFGGSGGLVIPLFFIGATAGYAFGGWFGLDPVFFAAIGLVALLAGATNTPLACTIIAVELFGRQIAPYAAMACAISFIITGYRSVYPYQVLAISKSSSLPAAIGHEMDQIAPHFKPRKQGLISALLRLQRRRQHPSTDTTHPE